VLLCLVVWVQQAFSKITKMVKERRGTKVLNLEGKTLFTKACKKSDRKKEWSGLLCPLKKILNKLVELTWMAKHDIVSK